MFDGLQPAHAPRWTAKGHLSYATMQLVARRVG